MTVVEQLLAWDGWHWMAGMRDRVYGRILDVDHSGEMFWVEVDGRSGSIVREDFRTIVLTKPDLDHLGTLGCIEHGLLREAWGPDASITVRSRPREVASVTVEIGGAEVFSTPWLPREDALVRSCLAAPR